MGLHLPLQYVTAQPVLLSRAGRHATVSFVSDKSQGCRCILSSIAKCQSTVLSYFDLFRSKKFGSSAAPDPASAFFRRRHPPPSVVMSDALPLPVPIFLSSPYLDPLLVRQRLASQCTSCINALEPCIPCVLTEQMACPQAHKSPLGQSPNVS